MRSVWGLLLMPILGATLGCDALWGSYTYPNPESCQPDPAICDDGWECNLQSEVCEPSAAAATVSTYAWIQQAAILAGDAVAFDKFGSSISLFGDTALIGSPGAAISGQSSSGAAYVFVRDPELGTWSNQSKLEARDFGTGDMFGNSVSLSGDTAIVGAYAADVTGNGGEGAAYIFARASSTSAFVQQAMLLASDRASGDVFGHAVTLSGDTALIGARLVDAGGLKDAGAAYIFTRKPGGSTWGEQVPRLTASDGHVADQFGYSVALSGDTALIGAPASLTTDGAAYVFVRNAASGLWTEQAKLVSNDHKPGDQFGFTVALDGDTALIGAPYSDDGNKSAAGAAYVFVRDATSGSWTQQARLLAADSTAQSNFGSQVALSENWAAIGAALAAANGYASAGAVYVLPRSVGAAAWTSAVQVRLSASDAAATDQAGVAIALSGDTLGVGAPAKDRITSIDVGGGYIFHSLKQNGSPCTAATQCSSGFCVDDVCCDSACGGGDDTDCQACSAAAGALLSSPGDGTCRPSRAGRLCRTSRGGADAPEGCDGQSLSCPDDR